MWLDEFLQLALRIVIVHQRGQVAGDGAVEIEHEAAGARVAVQVPPLLEKSVALVPLKPSLRVTDCV